MFAILGPSLWLSAGQEPVLTLKISVKSCDMDVNGNIYAVDEGLNLMLFKGSADTFKNFSVSNYGPDPIVDASNPLEPVVFFPSTGKTVWFDNQLNIGNMTDLFKAGIVQAAALGRSNDGSLWVFDNNSKTLKKISRSGQLIQESIVLSDFEATDLPVRIFDNGDKLGFSDRNYVAYVFDRNLVYLGAEHSYGTLQGLSDKSFFVSEPGYIVSYDLGGPGKDTVSETLAGAEVQRYLNGRILGSDGRSVFLQHTED